MALPTSGVISLNAIGVEYGYASGTFLNFNTMWGELGGSVGTNPDSMDEAYGWDRDFFDVGNGWMIVTSINVIDAGTQYYIQIFLDNDSQTASHSETVYWRLRVGGTIRYSGSVASGTRPADSSTTLNDNTTNTTYTPDNAQVSYDNTNWVAVTMTGP